MKKIKHACKKDDYFSILLLDRCIMSKNSIISNPINL